MIEAVVFDLDGVLIDSEPVWEEVRRAVVAEYGGQWKPETQDRLMGMSTGEWSRYLSDDLGVRLPPERVARGKPAPDIYLTVTGLLGVAPPAAAAVEDSSNGLRSAAAAGCQVIAVPHPRYPPAADALATARTTLKTLDDLTPALISGLG